LTISRDVIILLGVLVLYLNRCPVKINPSLLGKATTCIQAGTILIVLSKDYLDITFFMVYSFWLVAIVTVASGLQYIRRGLIILSQGVNSDFT
jgi:phosphatidylglycerophosphate synthase